MRPGPPAARLRQRLPLARGDGGVPRALQKPAEAARSEAQLGLDMLRRLGEAEAAGARARDGRFGKAGGRAYTFPAVESRAKKTDALGSKATDRRHPQRTDNA